MDILPEGLFFVLAVLIRINLERTDREAYEFVGLYVLFVLWMTLEPVGVTETVRGTRLAAERRRVRADSIGTPAFRPP